MAINARAAKGGGKTQDPVDPGSYPARLVQVIGLGLQPQEFQGETKEPRDEVSTTYELLDEFMKDEKGNDIEDKPRWQSEIFPLHNLAADRAKSTQRYVALDPELKYDGDWGKLLGAPCVVTIVNKAGSGKNKGKTYNNIASVAAMRSKEAGKAKALVNEPKFFDFYEPDIDIFMSLPEWLQKKIKDGLEYGGSELEELVAAYKPKDGDKKAKNEETEEPDDKEEDGKNW